MVCDIPNKIFLTLFFNVPFYFLANLRRTPAAFFTFYLFAFFSLLSGSMLFRAMGAVSRTLTQSIAPGAVFAMMLVIYTGFIVPIPSMKPWFRWFAYVDPAAYTFENLMINEVCSPFYVYSDRFVFGRVGRNTSHPLCMLTDSVTVLRPAISVFQHCSSRSQLHKPEFPTKAVHRCRGQTRIHGD